MVNAISGLTLYGVVGSRVGEIGEACRAGVLGGRDARGLRPHGLEHKRVGQLPVLRIDAVTSMFVALTASRRSWRAAVQLNRNIASA